VGRTQRLNDWMDPEKKFRFLSINNFASYLGIKQTAVMDLVNSKRIDSLTVDGRTWIPLSFRYSALWGYASDEESLPNSEINWPATKEEPEEDDPKKQS
jgi:hypothetical protein